MSERADDGRRRGAAGHTPRYGTGPAGGHRRGCVVVVPLLALFLWGVSFGGDDDSAFGPSPLDGEVAPALVGTTLDGAGYSIDNDRGSWVVVNFFATWCPPCVKEHPELVEFERRHADTGDRRVVSVVFGGSAETEPARRFFDQQRRFVASGDRSERPDVGRLRRGPGA